MRKYEVKSIYHNQAIRIILKVFYNMQYKWNDNVKLSHLFLRSFNKKSDKINGTFSVPYQRNCGIFVLTMTYLFS